VTDVVSIARAAVEGGADILSLINCLSGMAVDVNTRKPILGFVLGGLSGPAIKPVALRMVWEVYHARLGVPIVGIGGITTAIDAIEFILCGASAVQIGTANLIDPEVSVRVAMDLKDYCRGNGINHISELIGVLNDMHEDRMVC
jgi:dihydroorotate dehydrogenase (NAD+) catalytic subunit